MPLPELEEPLVAVEPTPDEDAVAERVVGPFVELDPLLEVVAVDAVVGPPVEAAPIDPPVEFDPPLAEAAAIEDVTAPLVALLVELDKPPVDIVPVVALDECEAPLPE